MAKVNFNAQLVAGKRLLTANLEMYIFQEDGIYVVYCPALDLSAYGQTEQEAKVGFEDTFRLHMEYCIKKNTLASDLQQHGWKVNGVKQKKIKAPSVELLLSSNEALKDIVFNKDYQKVSRPVQIPEFA